MGFDYVQFEINANGYPGILQIASGGAGTIFGTDPVDMFVAEALLMHFRRDMPSGRQYYIGGYIQWLDGAGTHVVASGTFTQDNDPGTYTWQATATIGPIVPGG